MDKKKIALMIVKKMGSPTNDQEMKTPDEHKESDDDRMGVEMAMEKFIEAVHEKDVKAATKSLLHFIEMSEEVISSDCKSSMHEKED